MLVGVPLDELDASRKERVFELFIYRKFSGKFEKSGAVIATEDNSNIFVKVQKTK